MTCTKNQPFEARDSFDTGNGVAAIYRLAQLESLGLATISELPFSIRILLESALRCCNGQTVTEEHVKQLAAWSADRLDNVEIPFHPSRVVLQDFTGVPALVDLAAMRSAMERWGGDPKKINPMVPADLVVDHSVQVDRFASQDALAQNVELEFERNLERYQLLRWGQNAFDKFRVVPPNTGIVHQVNLEYLAKGVFLGKDDQGLVAFPDSLVGTDSHTTMINGLGVLGWGVGGIEAEAVMLGQPYYMLAPAVVGLELTGQLEPGATATDLVLTVTELLRREGVVGKFVEFFGSGVSRMSLADRATLANMAPEYGATIGFFPTDQETLNYLQRTGRTETEVELVERYTKEQGLFHTDEGTVPSYSRTLTLELGEVEPSLAGPKRPQDRVPLSEMKHRFHQSLRAPSDQRGYGLDVQDLSKTAVVSQNGHQTKIGHGAVVIAAITSCTNTSNPSVMIAAGLLAQKALQQGLQVPSYVKTSLAPGSRVVTDYFQKSGLDKSLEALGFYTVGYGCTTCIGNSGPLPEAVTRAVHAGDLVVAAVLSGNRNFEGRINSEVKANYLASPPLVVAYALAGTTDIDLIYEPLGKNAGGEDVYLKDVWPREEEIDQVVQSSVQPGMFRNQYHQVWTKNARWNEIEFSPSAVYPWNAASTYIQEPPFLLDLTPQPEQIRPITAARALLVLGDSTTTDHISPAGAIARDSPAGHYLQEHGVVPQNFNSYGSRRGNDHVMTRGTFANIRIRNRLAPGTEGGFTRHLPEGTPLTVYEAAERYRSEGVPLLVLAGAEYGTGSSRDWAAKGTQLLGVRAVLATSYERIHRSNLVGMGVLPLEFTEGATWQSLGLTGEEQFDLPDLNDQLQPGAHLHVKATAEHGTAKRFVVQARIDTPVELHYYRHGGILPSVLRGLLARPQS